MLVTRAHHDLIMRHIGGLLREAAEPFIGDHPTARDVMAVAQDYQKFIEVLQWYIHTLGTDAQPTIIEPSVDDEAFMSVVEQLHEDTSLRAAAGFTIGASGNLTTP